MPVTDQFAMQSPGSKEKISIEAVSTVASATALPAPTTYMTVVSGTTQLTGITLPYAGFAGTIALQPTGAFTGATGFTPTAAIGAIGLAFTAVVGKTLFMTYLPSTQLWYPSYVS